MKLTIRRNEGDEPMVICLRTDGLSQSTLEVLRNPSPGPFGFEYPPEMELYRCDPQTEAVMPGINEAVKVLFTQVERVIVLMAEAFRREEEMADVVE